ncbi:hypothetical protein [Cystobacter ferrugineus]|uniref:Uncharacterized protein n=1 Tax=Cystobacter ferrugineus TaxID=83449 RepID=A0A1L9AXW4_9BACT|nr:hypothetical protein [Cystobacter ferrugineus]OJH34763.1 hypothetical protein BON30_42160 [Cystobacter ferrugineus]
MSLDVPVRGVALRIEDTELKKALGHPQPTKSGLVVFDPSAAEPEEEDAVSGEEPNVEPVAHP